MNSLDVNKLISYKSIIHHNLYKDGIYIKSMYDVIYVQFDYDTIQLRLNDYQKSWFVKNYSGYQIDGSKLLSTSREFENSFLNSTIQQVDREIKKLENDIFNVSNIGYDSSMNKAAKIKGKLEANKSALIPMKWHPYFARIDLVESNNPENGVSYYLTGDTSSKNGINVMDIIQLDNVVDWRSEEAVPFYQQDMYSNEESEIKLVLRREYEINNLKLVSIEDNLNSDKELIDQVADERLIQHIKNNRDKHIKNIIQTIKTNQYRIISHNQNRNILVQGCAGSGKTMILAHRLTFWLFRLKEQLKIEDAFIVSPTKLLSLEMTRLDLNINKANFMTNLEFNKYLIEHICQELNIDANLEEKYISNNSLNSQIIKKAYSSLVFDDYKVYMGILEDKEDEDVYNDFICYLNKRLNELYNKLYNSKNNISIEDQEKHFEIYSQIIDNLKKITYVDVATYKDYLESQNKEYINLQDEIKRLKREFRNLKKKYNEELEKTTSIHEEFLNLEFKDVLKLLHIWKKELDRTENELNDLGELIYNFEKDMSIYKEKSYEIELLNEQISKSNFFIRRRLERNKKELLSNLVELTNEIEHKYSSYNLSIDTNIDDIKQRKNECSTILKNEYSYYNYLLDASHKLSTQAKKIKDIELVLNEVDVEKLAIDKKKLKILNEIITMPDYLLSNDQSKNEESIEKIIDELMNFKIPSNKSLKSFISMYEDYKQSNEYMSVQKYINDDDCSLILMFFVEYIIHKFKKDFEVDEQHYEFEIFLKLYFLYDRDNISKINHKWLFIDEFQDYSYWEIEIYRTLFANTSFNYFGDMNQNINVKGIGQRELELLTNKKFDAFEINENYRNAIEITEYVNKKMNLNMYPIGSHGVVKEGTIFEFMKIIEGIDDKTIAIVLTDEYQKNILLNLKSENEFFFLNENHTSIKNDSVNVLTPLSVKGLEFDVVCVFEKNMTDNEKYVSFTRALNYLFVINEEV